MEGGFGKTFPSLTSVGVVGYAQWKVTEDTGNDIPLILRAPKDRIFALGPEVALLQGGLVIRYYKEFWRENKRSKATTSWFLWRCLFEIQPGRSKRKEELLMNETVNAAIHFIDGGHLTLSWPQQAGSDAADIALNVRKALDMDKLVVEADGQLLVIPLQ